MKQIKYLIFGKRIKGEPIKTKQSVTSTYPNNLTQEEYTKTWATLEREPLTQYRTK